MHSSDVLCGRGRMTRDGSCVDADKKSISGVLPSHCYHTAITRPLPGYEQGIKRAIMNQWAKAISYHRMVV